MSECFAAGLPRLHALASQMLGWCPGEFWRSTPEELSSALSDPATPLTASISRNEIDKLLERDNHG